MYFSFERVKGLKGRKAVEGRGSSYVVYQTTQYFFDLYYGDWFINT
jgi:hypothetical protein